jgi:hypothetical protein
LNQVKNPIGLRLFAHLPVLKIIAAVIIAIVAYLTTEKSSTVAAATVLYASVLTFRELGDYASLRLKIDSKNRWAEKNRIDDLQASIKVDNVGPVDARRIDLSAVCIDPIRNKSTELIETSYNDGDLDPDNFKLNRGLSENFRVNASGNANKSDGYQLQMFDRVGIHPWLVIKANSPDSFMTSTLYVPFPEEDSINRESVSAVFSVLSEDIENRKSKAERLTDEEDSSK